MATEAFSVASAPLRGLVAVPGSKSVSNRALVCAALASGESVLHGLADGDDTSNMLSGLRLLGARVTTASEAQAPVRVQGPIDTTATEAVLIDAGLAGTTSRFLTAVGALRRGPTTVTGGPGLRARPMGELHRILRELGFVVQAEREGFLPVIVHTAGRDSDRSSSRLAHQVRVSGEVSSQFISAVMLIAPLIGGVRLQLAGPVVSRGYLDMTAEVMQAFGSEVEVREDEIAVSAHPFTPTTYEVDADWSSASYPFAAAAIVGGEVTVPRLRRNESQPEESFTEVLMAMGCSVRSTDDGVTVGRSPTTSLRGVDVDMSTMSDLVPTVAAIAACASTPSHIRGVGFIRAKESDRLGDLAHELSACGVAVEVESDGLSIEPSPLRPAVLNSHDDHRLAMSLALLSLRCESIRISDPEVVSKSWPTYWKAMRAGLALA